MKDIFHRFGFELRFGYGAKIVLYILAALFPLFLLPLQIGVENGREIFFGTLVILVAVLWLLEVLTSGKIRYQHSWIGFASLALFLVFALSAIFSRAPWFSFLLADPAAERFSTIILALVLMFLSGSVIKTKQEAASISLILIFSGAVSALITLIQLIWGRSLYGLVIPLATGSDFNVVGTINGLSLFYVMLFAVGAGLLTSSWLLATKLWLRIALGVSLALFLADLLLINFRASWVLLLVSSVFLFGFMFRKKLIPEASGTEDAASAVRQKEEKANAGEEKNPLYDIDWRYWLALVLVAFAGLMIFVRGPIFGRVLVPAEVSPSFKTTLALGREIFKEGIKETILGSGPGTFGLNWSRYRSSAINQTQFWNIRFNQGFSWLTTLLSTVGVAGILVFILFLGMTIFLFTKTIVFLPAAETEIAVALFSGFATSVAAAVFYPVNFTLALLLFLSVGLLSSLLASDQTGKKGEAEEAGKKPFWQRWLTVEGRELVFESQWATFLSSLSAVFFVSLSIGAVYYEVGKFREGLWQQSGARNFAVGSMDAALSAFERAVQLQPKNFKNYQSLVQLRTEKARNLIQRAAGGENIQQEFQANAVAAIQNSQAALGLMPYEPALWRTQGALYEVMIPFINGSERFAFDSYKRATELDPVNPALWVDWGRAGLAFADKLSLFANQASGNEREEFLKARTNTLQEVATVFRKAAEVKGDFAPAHFLLSQTAIRLGDLRSAIRATENAKITAPFDVGVAFQLGLLYYQAGDLARAQTELERAISLNENYSNARYFLGLVHDRKGERLKAIEQFVRIAALNPDNQEVKNILENLRSGRGALENIVPPAEPPAQRSVPPVAR